MIALKDTRQEMIKDASLNNSEHIWNTQDIYPNCLQLRTLTAFCYKNSDPTKQNNLFPVAFREVRCPVFRVSKHFVSSVSPALCLAFRWRECWMAGNSCVVFWWMGWMWGAFPVGVFFFFRKKWCFFKILMQQDQPVRKADLLIEWGAFFYLLFDWELVESFSRLLTNNLGCWSTIIGWNLCQIRDGLGDYPNVMWDGVLPSDLFFQDGGIFESEDMVYRHHLGTRLIALDRFLFCFIPHCMAWFDVQCWVFL